jgi:hypothetical protein
MKVDFSAKILGLDGSPLREPGASEDLTLASIVCSTLINLSDKDKDMSAADKVAMFKLAVKITANGKDVTLDADEIVRLKNRVGVMCTPLIVGRAYELLDPGSV